MRHTFCGFKKHTISCERDNYEARDFMTASWQFSTSVFINPPLVTASLLRRLIIGCINASVHIIRPSDITKKIIEQYWQYR